MKDEKTNQQEAAANASHGASEDILKEQTENMANESDNEEGNDTESGKDELARAKDENKELSDKYLRLVAEFDNFRKRTARERNELIKSAGEDIVKSLLDVLDDAERAEQQLDKVTDVASLKTGMALIFNKLRNVLAAKGLQKMESKGAEFNPELHDAITEIPAPTEKESGKILDEVQAGYLLNDKIIRHAKVVVGK